MTGRGLVDAVRRRPAAVRALLAMCLVSSGSAFVSAAAPLTPQAPVGLNAAAGALALLLAAVVWRVQDRRVLHAGVVVHVLGIAGLVSQSATGTGAAGVMLGAVWVALYAAFFLGRSAGRRCSVLVAVALGVALLVNPFLGAAHLWLLTSTTTLLATELVGRTVEQLQSAALTDPLTRACNRSGLQRRTEAALAGGGPLALAVLDLDGFKAVNDRYGHAAGDALLVACVDAWRRELRRDDVLARQGGDEFVLLLPGSDRADARTLLARLRTVSPAGWSSGVATARPGDDLDALLLRADQELYAEKRVRAAVPAPR